MMILCFVLKDNKLIPSLALNFATPRDNPTKGISENGDRFILYQSGMPGFFIICILTIEDINLYKLGRGGEKYYFLLFQQLYRRNCKNKFLYRQLYWGNQRFSGSKSG